MLLTKSCHDLDWLSVIVGAPVARVSSFGSRTLFTAANKPAAASDRCITCAIEPECAFSAVAMYHAGLDPDRVGVVLHPHRRPGGDACRRRRGFPRGGPFGRCVFESDNDVVDHQVVAIEYANGSHRRHSR